MTDAQLLKLHEQVSRSLGYKTDMYHSEAHCGCLFVPHGKPLNELNVVYAFQYAKPKKGGAA